jgi:DNA-binding response OmpR family regulator
MEKKHKIMVIEDEGLLLKAIQMKLSNFNVEVFAYTNAKDALNHLKSGENLPDAIWLDYYLQDMNGLEFVNELKKLDNVKETPIVVVSNSASDEKTKNMLALGVKKYLLKAQYKLEDIAKIIIEIIESEGGGEN